MRVESGFELCAVCIDYAILPLHNVHRPHSFVESKAQKRAAPPEKSNWTRARASISVRWPLPGVPSPAPHPPGMNTIRRPPSPPSRLTPSVSGQRQQPPSILQHHPLAPQFPNQGLGGPPQACFNLGCPRAAFTQSSALKPESLRGCLGPGRGGEALPGACEEGWVGWGEQG